MDLEKRIQTLENQDIKQKLEDYGKELQSLRNRYLERSLLVATGATLGIVTGIIFYFCLRILQGGEGNIPNGPSWQQICGVIGLSVPWVFLAVTIMRILSERRK